MRGMHVNALLCFCVDPSANGATASEHKLMWAVAVDESEFKIIAEWSDRYSLPHSSSYASLLKPRL